MSAPFVKLFTHPEFAWTDIREQEQIHPRHYLAHLLLLASAYSTFLLFVGLPKFMSLRKEQGLLYSASVWGVGLLVLVTILVEMILLWFNYLQPEYLRLPVG